MDNSTNQPWLPTNPDPQPSQPETPLNQQPPYPAQEQSYSTQTPIPATPSWQNPSPSFTQPQPNPQPSPSLNQGSKTPPYQTTEQTQNFIPTAPPAPPSDSYANSYQTPPASANIDSPWPSQPLAQPIPSDQFFTSPKSYQQPQAPLDNSQPPQPADLPTTPAPSFGSSTATQQPNQNLNDFSIPPSVTPNPPAQESLASISNILNQTNQYTDPNGSLASDSSLDNPFGVSTQPPPIDSNLQPTIPQQTQGEDITPSAIANFPPNQTLDPQPTQPPQNTTPWSAPESLDNPGTTPAAVSEQAPTDLSHLISNSETDNQAQQAETILIPQTNVPVVPSVTKEDKPGIPKWVIGLGVGLLILVAGASAYFILGIGQSGQNISLPASEAPKVSNQPVAQTTPIPTPTIPPVAPVAQATSSADFASLEGTVTSAPPQASSAADIIRARQETASPQPE